MADESTLPVWMPVTRADGSTEQVQLGVAVRTATGFMLQLAQLRIGGADGGATVAAIAPQHNTVQDLESLASRARRILADPRKAKWHEAERALLAAIEAELARKRLPRAG